MEMSAPEGVSASRVETGAATKNGTPAVWAASAIEAAGRNWEFTVVDGASHWIPTRVDPFANTARAKLTLQGAHRLQLLYRR